MNALDGGRGQAPRVASAPRLVPRPAQASRNERRQPTDRPINRNKEWLALCATGRLAHDEELVTVKIRRARFHGDWNDSIRAAK